MVLSIRTDGVVHLIITSIAQLEMIMKKKNISCVILYHCLCVDSFEVTPTTYVVCHITSLSTIVIILQLLPGGHRLRMAY